MFSVFLLSALRKKPPNHHRAQTIMTVTPTQPERERRIYDEIIVDAYDEVERAMGWYYYLESALLMPFKAECFVQRPGLLLKVGDAVEVINMADEDQCMHEVFVQVKRGKKTFIAPLGQLACYSNDELTCEAVEDWHYWQARGYEY